MKQSIRLATLLTAITLAFSALSFSVQAVAANTALKGVASNFALPSSAGGQLQLSDFKGEVVMVNFWASWCGPCREEMPLLEGLHKKYSKLGFTVLGVNVDANPKDAQKMLAEIKTSFPMGFDSKNKVSELYKVDSMPSTVMVDRHGNMRFLHRGYKPGYEADYEKQIRALIREP
jgi:thiol-disulfide isomerase/thioredoxin